MTRSFPHPRFPYAARAAFAAALLVAGGAACGGEGGDPLPPGLMDRETFIATYVELRAAAIVSDDQDLSPEARDRVLATQGVDADDLLDFAEAHGRDIEFMREVWNEVESRLEEHPLLVEADGA